MLRGTVQRHRRGLHWDILERYDQPHTFFYLDPPYYGLKVYRHNLEPEDFEKMAGILARVKGKFLMSHNDHPAVRRILMLFRFTRYR